MKVAVCGDVVVSARTALTSLEKQSVIIMTITFLVNVFGIEPRIPIARNSKELLAGN